MLATILSTSVVFPGFNDKPAAAFPPPLQFWLVCVFLQSDIIGTHIFYVKISTVECILNFPCALRVKHNALK